MEMVSSSKNMKDISNSAKLRNSKYQQKDIKKRVNKL